MQNTIGFRLDSEEDDEDGEEFDVEMVGQGCASLTPDEPGVDLGDLVKHTLKLRKVGAQYVRFGDYEVSFVAPTKDEEK